MNHTKQQQLLSHIKRTVSQAILELDHEQFHNVVVTDILLSNDSSKCRVIVVATPGQIDRLNQKEARSLRTLFRNAYQRRNVPTLEFVLDDGSRDHLEQLLVEATQTPQP